MKNQYVADAGDFGKYGLLRYLAGQGIKIAVNWYLTLNDGTKDGKHVSYLQDSAQRRKDPELFDCLESIISSGTRSVEAIENAGLIKDACYYSDILDMSEALTVSDRQEVRKKWHAKSLDACRSAELVFLDPDNGVKEDTSKGLKSAVKYAFTSEIADYYNRGQNVMYYCSKARRSEKAWDEYKHIMPAHLADARLIALTYSGGTQRSYIFVLHEDSFMKYTEIVEDFLESPWKTGRNSFRHEEI